jgi:hypothetical protein
VSQEEASASAEAAKVYALQYVAKRIMAVIVLLILYMLSAAPETSGNRLVSAHVYLLQHAAISLCSHVKHSHACTVTINKVATQV